MYHPDLSPVEPLDTGIRPLVEETRRPRYELETDSVYDGPVFGKVYVGWLDTEHPFPTGPASGPLVRLLHAVAPRCMKNTVIWLGHHNCPFCGACPKLNVAGQDAVLGACTMELEVGQATFLIPGLILHYVEAHNYVPPTQFLEAVIEVARSLSVSSETPAPPE